MFFKIGVLKSFQTSQESTSVADFRWLLLGKDIGKFREGSSVVLNFAKVIETGLIETKFYGGFYIILS